MCPGIVPRRAPSHDETFRDARGLRSITAMIASPRAASWRPAAPVQAVTIRTSLPSLLLMALVASSCQDKGPAGAHNMIEKLEFIIALARERHFGHAAEACGVSQPTLSAGLKQLADYCGLLLVQRGSRFQGFTPEGERVLDWARRIVGETRAMHQEIDALKRGLVGHIRIAAVPTALAMVEMLTTPYRAKHPDVSFTIWSRNSIEVLGLLENLEIDAGLTYLDNEPLGRVQTVALYSEEYRLLTYSDAPLGNRDSVTWAEVGKVPLCLLTPDMQNRRIIDGLLREAGAESSPTPESDSILVLFAHVRTGRWASVMPAKLASVLGLTDTVRAIPIVKPEVTHSIGLVVPHRNPLTPLINALVNEAKQLAPILGSDSPPKPRRKRDMKIRSPDRTL